MATHPTSKHLVKHRDEIDGALAQVTEVYSVDDNSNQKRQKFYKNFGFAVLISEVENTAGASELALNKATSSDKK